MPPAPATARAVQDDGDAIETRIVPGVSPRFLEAMSWMLAIRPNQRPQSGEQLRAVLDGRAEIPPRGRPGVTVPGALAPSTGPQIEQVADATRINTAYLPTHLPTARVAPAIGPARDDHLQPEGADADGAADADRGAAATSRRLAGADRDPARRDGEPAGATGARAAARDHVAATGTDARAPRRPPRPLRRPPVPP